MKRAFAMCLLLVTITLLAAGCATTGTSDYPRVEVGGYNQFRYTTFHGGTW